MKTLVRNYDLFPALFNDFLLDNVSTKKTLEPLANIKESDKDFKIELAVPGFKKDDFKVEINDRSLSISAEEKSEEAENTENYVRKEFSYYAFSRTFKLPRSIDVDQILAIYENGILILTLPKKEEAKTKEPRLISIG